MKKLLAVLLAALLLLGLTGTALAADDDAQAIDKVDITIFMPLCGTVVSDVNRADVAEVYVETEGVRIADWEMVRDFDEEELTGQPFSGTIQGGETYAILMTLETEDDIQFDGKMCWDLLADGDDLFASILSDTSVRLAVVCTAEHDWGEWTLVQEPTAEEDGLWERVCQGDSNHAETEIAPAGEDPVEPGTVGPVLHEIEVEVSAPMCGDEITEENRQGAVWTYYYPEEIISTEHCELVTDYDGDDTSVFTPFLGTVIGGEEYTALLTFTTGEEHRIAPDVDICVTCLDNISFEVLEQTEQRITLAVTFTADHDWGDWYVEKEPTDDEDGLWKRVCQYDPDHVETEVIPALTSGQIPEVNLDLTFPCCGYEVGDSYVVENETLYLYGDGVFFESGKLVSNYDPEHPDEAVPFTGTAAGGEEYTFLISLKCGDGRWFDEDTEITAGFPYDAEVEILEMTEHTMLLAVTTTAEHCWGEWYVEKQPTEDEDGLWVRVCAADPEHVETEIIPAGSEPVEPGEPVDPEDPTDPGEPWNPDDPELFAAEIEVMTPVCGDEVNEDNCGDVVFVYPWPEDTMVVERCELVTDYDHEDPTVFTPFLGTVVGGQEYTFLLTIEPDEGRLFGEDMTIGFYEDFLYSWEILEQTQNRITLAVTFTAEHDWGEWYVEKEPTEDEDGLRMRVCQYDPDHVETEIIPAGEEIDPIAPEPEIDPTVPTDEPTEPTGEPTEPGGEEQGRDVPVTGDGSNPFIWCAAAVLSAAGLAGLAALRKKRTGR